MITIEKARLKRLHSYLLYLKFLDRKSRDYVSTHRLAKDLKLDTSLICEDLECLNSSYSSFEIHKTKYIIEDLEEVLGLFNPYESVLVTDLPFIEESVASPEIKNRGISITAVFTDVEKKYRNEKINKDIFPVVELPELVDRMNIKVVVLNASKEKESKYIEYISNTSINTIFNLGNNRIQTLDKVFIENFKTHE